MLGAAPLRARPNAEALAQSPRLSNQVDINPGVSERPKTKGGVSVQGGVRKSVKTS